MGKVRMNTKPPAAWRPNLVRRKPTVDEVVAAAAAHGIFGQPSLDQASRCLPVVLEGKPLGQSCAPDAPPVQQFKAGMDPYVFVLDMRAYERKYGVSGRGWIANASRLLVLWVAAELFKQGVGGGPSDHFHGSQRDASLSSQDASVERSDVTVASLAEATGVADPPPSVVPVAVTTPLVDAPLAPPSYIIQRNRTLGLHTPLINFLKGGCGKKKRRKIDYFRRQQGVWNGIKEWLNTPEGRGWVEQCGIGPDGWQLDHAFPESLGGPSHVFNAHLMPANVNARFGNRWDEEKRAYIGSDQERCSIAVMKWMRTTVEWEAFTESEVWAAYEMGRA